LPPPQSLPDRPRPQRFQPCLRDSHGRDRDLARLDAALHEAADRAHLDRAPGDAHEILAGGVGRLETLEGEDRFAEDRLIVEAHAAQGLVLLIDD
jgi:hypothetical protein